MLKIIIEKNRY